jgi:DMSO reductase anchor subunit
MPVNRQINFYNDLIFLIVIILNIVNETRLPSCVSREKKTVIDAMKLLKHWQFVLFALSGPGMIYISYLFMYVKGARDTM